MIVIIVNIVVVVHDNRSNRIYYIFTKRVYDDNSYDVFENDFFFLFLLSNNRVLWTFVKTDRLLLKRAEGVR